MAVKEFLNRSEAGIDHYLIHEADGSLNLQSVQDPTEILDANKAMYTHNDGYTPDRTMRRAASIPQIVRYKWLVEEGWDCALPENWDKLRAKLNSSDWLYLRTAPGHL